MKAPEILETTLRDGSYAIDFQFAATDTTLICRELEAAGFDLIEVGHGIGLGASEADRGVAAETDHEQTVETLAGRRLPLSAALHSQPFEGIVKKDELLAHLSPEPVSVWPERTWVLCGRAALTEPQYRVRIRASFSVGMVAL